MSNKDLFKYFSIIRRWLWLVIVCTLLAAGVAFIVSSQMTPVYSASATLLVHQAPTSGSSDYTAILTSERLARTYTQMLQGRPILEAVIQQLGLNQTPQNLAQQIKVELVRDTQLIKLSVENTSPPRAALLANAIAEAFIAKNQTLQQERYADSMANMQKQIIEMSDLIQETQATINKLDTPTTTQEQNELAQQNAILASYRNSYASLLQNYEQMRVTAAGSADNIIIFESAQIPEKPVRPRTLVNTALAGIVGAVLAMGAAFLIEYLDDTIKTPDDVSQALGLGTLGTIGQLRENDGELITAEQPLSPLSEAFRVLRTNIRFSNIDRPLQTLLVTSTGPSEGKSTTVANLAVVMAQAGLKVITVDADLRRPRLQRVFSLQPREGLSESLLEGCTNGRLQPVKQIEGLQVLLSGNRPPNPAEMLSSQRMRELLAELKQKADVVLVDSPPILPVADAAVLAQQVDGVILVVDAGAARREVVRRALANLSQVGANVAGVVLNRVTSDKGGYYYYYYYQHYYTDDGTVEKKKHRRHKRENPWQWLVGKVKKDKTLASEKHQPVP